MTKFIQIHALISYAAANLNRDDTGRPKSMVYGNTHRLRVSSQAMKRAWRTAELPRAEHGVVELGTRTNRLARKVFEQLIGDGTTGISRADALKWAMAIVQAFTGKPKADNAGEDAGEGSGDGSQAPQPDAEPPAQGDATEAADADATGERGKGKGKNKGKDKGKRTEAEAKQEKDEKKKLDGGALVFYSHHEIQNVWELVATLISERRPPTADELKALPSKHASIDVALGGRMMAGNPALGMEAALQVGHAFTVQCAIVEDDYVTAVDELNEESAGAGHVTEQGFGTGVFYVYACINYDLLVKNLGGDEKKAQTAVQWMTDALATVSPGGKRSSFASNAYASYVMAEIGNRMPRGLSAAYLTPVTGQNVLEKAIVAIKETRDQFESAYETGLKVYEMNVLARQGTRKGLMAFLAE